MSFDALWEQEKDRGGTDKEFTRFFYDAATREAEARVRRECYAILCSHCRNGDIPIRTKRGWYHQDRWDCLAWSLRNALEDK